jgi:hypothetical protein
VKDRFFNGGHSSFFASDRVRDYWLPYLRSGQVVDGILDRSTNPWWVSFLTVFKLRYVVLAALIFGAYMSYPAVVQRAALQEAIGPEPTGGSAVLFDGFIEPEHSAFVFATGQVVSWHAGVADIGAVRGESDRVTGLFLPYDGEIYKDSPPDRIANAGIQEIMTSSFDDVTRCPTSQYLHHWFKPQKGHFYCVRTRNGRDFALIRIDAIDVDRIGFEYLLKPAANR